LTCVLAAVGVGIAAGAVARVLQQATLEQKVPFTLRKHTLLLPVFAELLLGQFSFAQVRSANCTIYSTGWVCQTSAVLPY
jgi:fluoride ion exporter CrcB/FEX